MSEHKEYAPIHFLTNQENEVMTYLMKAMDLFDEICHEDPQDPADTFNFGHYIDAAKGAVILRGARRMEPNVLLKPKKFPFQLPQYMGMEWIPDKMKVDDEDLKALALSVTRQQFAQYGMGNLPDEVISNYSQEMLKNKDLKKSG